MNGIIKVCCWYLLSALISMGVVYADEVPPNFLNAWGTEWLETPKYVAVNTDTNHVYVTDTVKNRVFVFDQTGNYLNSWGGLGSGDGQFHEPRGIAISADGSVYVVDFWNNRIQRFSADGIYLGQWGKLGGSRFDKPSTFIHPSAIAIDKNGLIYISDDNSRIQRYNLNGDYIDQWNNIPTNYASGSSLFDHITVSDSGSIYLTDQFQRAVVQLNNNGDYIKHWGGYGQNAGQFSTPSGIAVDSMGSVYIADIGNNRIQKFNKDGVFLSQWGGYGNILSGDNFGKFYHPNGLTIGKDDRIFITDTDNHRVQQFAYPNQPSNLEGIALGVNRVQLKWTDNTANETQFMLERCKGNGCTNFAVVATSPAQTGRGNSITLINGISPSSALTAYTYRVRALLTNQQYSEYSTPIVVTTLAALDVPTNLNITLSNPESSRPQLSWVYNGNDPVDFNIERCQGSGCTNFVMIKKILATKGNISFLDNNLAANNYQYRVKAVRATEASGYSNIAAITVLGLNAPSNLTAAMRSGYPKLNWLDNSKIETAFQIERCLVDPALGERSKCITAYSQVGVVNANTVTFTDLKPITGAPTGYTVYLRYRVRAVQKEASVSGYSNTVIVKPLN